MSLAARSRLLVAAGCVAVGVLCGCGDDVAWTPQERDNARHVVRSLAAASRASQLAARAGSGLSRDELGALRAELRAALIEATLVDDAVLTKAHDQMPRRWRRDYQVALRGLLDHYSGRSVDGSDPAARFDAFIAWYRATQPEFRWWSGGPEGG